MLTEDQKKVWMAISEGREMEILDHTGWRIISNAAIKTWIMGAILRRVHDGYIRIASKEKIKAQ